MPACKLTFSKNVFPKERHKYQYLIWFLSLSGDAVVPEGQPGATSAKTQQVINKISSKRVQDHATYLPVNMVCDWCRPSALNVVRDWSISSALNISHLETNK